MADRQADIDFLQRARSAGYSDGELRTLAAKSGWDQARIQDRLPPTVPQDTFLGESGLGALGGLLKQGVQSLASDPLHTLWGAVSGQTQSNLLQGAIRGVDTDTRSELGQSGEAAKQFIHSPSVGGANDILTHAISAVPVIGHPVGHGIRNIQQGNLGGLAGDLTALFGPEIARGVGGEVGALGRSTGENLYKGAVPFKPSMSLEDIDAATRLGLDKSLPTGKASVKRIGSTTDPVSVMGDLESQIQPYVSGVNGAMATSPGTILQPFLKKIGQVLQDPTDSAHGQADAMLKEIQPWLESRDPIMKQVFAPATQNTPALSTAQKIHMIDNWAQNSGASGGSVAEAHAAKKALYRNISDSQYADNSSALPSGSKVAKEELARGFKNGVNEVHPEITGLNNQMHDAINLQDSLTEQAKKRPDEAKNLLLWSLGIAGGETAAAMGHSYVGMAGLTAIAARQALSNPGIASRLAVAFGDSPQVIQHLSSLGPSGAVAGQVARAAQTGPPQAINPASLLQAVQQHLGIDSVQPPPQQ